MTCQQPTIEDLQQSLRELTSRYSYIRQLYLSALEDCQTWRNRAVELEKQIDDIVSAVNELRRP